MFYIIITGRSIFWFILTLVANIFVLSAIVTPKWLISPIPETELTDLNITINRYPSVGIYTRCKIMNNIGYHCGNFDMDGFSTDSKIFPPEWKACFFIISMGFIFLSITVFMTVITCCRQSIFGKSFHNLTGCAQVIAGIMIMLSLFCYPLGWGAKRVKVLCGKESEPFYPGDCTLGLSFYCAIFSIITCFLAAAFSSKAEIGNMRSKVKKRIEEGDRLVCLP